MLLVYFSENDKLPDEEAVTPPHKRKNFEFSAFEEYRKKPRYEQTQMYANFPFTFLHSMPPSCSMPNSPEPSEPAHSPYNGFNMPPSPISVVSCHSERRNQSTSSPSSPSCSSISALSPKMLPLRKRLSHADASHYSSEEHPNDLSDLIDTPELMRQLSASQSVSRHQELMSALQAEQMEQARSPASHYQLHNSNNNNLSPNNRPLDIASMLSVMAPENRLYFLALVNFYCSSGQDLIGTNQLPSAPPSPRFPFMAN